jgi:molybdenum cofactor biosynthesis enzyme MoaA
MKAVLISLVCLFVSVVSMAQQYVIDYQHMLAVTQNGAARSSAEITHGQYLAKINDNINSLNTNVASVVLAQNMIYEGLANVNSALKNGLEVKNMVLIIADMTGYINQALTLAKAEPYLLVFAGNISSEMRTRALALVSEVSGYVLKEGNNVLADYNARDQLLRKITQQLQILDGLAYGAWKAMYWAKERGVIASLNPFAGFINRDKIFVAQIIQNARFLRQ